MKAIHQSAPAECGLACLAMICSHFGSSLDLPAIRRKFRVSLKGMRLDTLLRYASELGLSGRALRLDVDELSKLRTPAVLHFDFDHFVVLESVNRKGFVVLDPAVGQTTVSHESMGRRFTGVAIEFTQRTEFGETTPIERLRIGSFFQATPDLRNSLGKLFLITAVLQVFALLGPFMNQIVIDDVLTTNDSELLRVVLVGFGLLLLLQTALGVFRSWCVIRLGQSLGLRWASSLFGRLIRLPSIYFMERHTGDITSRFGSLGIIQRTLTTSLIEFFMDAVMCVAALVMMFMLSTKLAYIVICASLLYIALHWWMQEPFRVAASERIALGAKESTYFLETIRSIIPIKLSGKLDERRARWSNLVVDIQNRDAKTAILAMISTSANGLIFGVENLLVFWFGVQFIFEAGTSAPGDMFTLGMFFAFLAYKSQFVSRIGSIVSFVSSIHLLKLHTDRVADIALTEPENLGHSRGGGDIDIGDATLEFKNVSFRYGEGEPWVLKNVSFRIDAGECIAITGPSGAGKTTLMKIALGLLVPTEGDVYFGEHSLRIRGLEWYRQRVGAVMQDDALVQGNIGDNIALFDEDPDQIFIEDCAKRSRIHGDITAMPMGYKSLIGDLASGLSGGQKQRIMLARALYRKPALLLLDEATSHLDGDNERAIAKELNSLGITRIIVAHRGDTIKSADRVFFVALGSATEIDRESIKNEPDSSNSTALSALIRSAVEARLIQASASNSAG